MEGQKSLVKKEAVDYGCRYSHSNAEERSVNPRIFTLGLSIEAVSLDLILADLEARPAPLTRQACAGLWNGSPDSLEQSFLELEMHSIVDVAGDRFSLRPELDWREGRDA